MHDIYAFCYFLLIGLCFHSNFRRMYRRSDPCFDIIIYSVFVLRKLTLITLVCVNVMEYKVVHITRYTLWLIVVLLINIGCVLVCQIILTKITSTALNQFFLLVWCHQISCKIWYEVVKVNLHAALLYLLWAKLKLHWVVPMSGKWSLSE
jgi:hypothetical protein